MSTPRHTRPRVNGSTRSDGAAVAAAKTAAGSVPAPGPVLSFDRVSFGYGRTPILREVSLHVREREFVAVMGVNGAGKSSLLRLALGLLRPATGAVRLFGRPLDAPPRERFSDWSRIGYVPQRATEPTALPVSVEEVVRTGLAGALGLVRRPSPEQRERMEDVLDLMGLAALRGKRVSSLSGGQQQRAVIARALVTSPSLLLLDEPTTGTDAEARAVLRESLENLVEVEGVAVVYVSHDLESFAGLADRVVELRAGRLVDRADLAGGRRPA